MTGLGTLIDSDPSSANNLNMLNTGLTLGLQYWLTRSLLVELGHPVSGSPRGFAFIGLGIVGGLGILLGMVLLVIPGLILLVRWSISVPCLLASDEGVFDNLRRSWDQTAGHFWPILISFLVIYGPALGVVILGGMMMELTEQRLVGSVLMNAALSGALVAGWVASMAIFTMLNQSPTVADIFE